MTRFNASWNGISSVTSKRSSSARVPGQKRPAVGSLSLGGATSSKETVRPLDSAAAVPPLSAAAPFCCAWLWCESPATNGDVCLVHFEQTQDLRDEWTRMASVFEREDWE